MYTIHMCLSLSNKHMCTCMCVKVDTTEKLTQHVYYDHH